VCSASTFCGDFTSFTKIGLTNPNNDRRDPIPTRKDRTKEEGKEDIDKERRRRERVHKQGFAW